MSNGLFFVLKNKKIFENVYIGVSDTFFSKSGLLECV